jgi:hypothetical protein
LKTYNLFRKGFAGKLGEIFGSLLKKKALEEI